MEIHKDSYDQTNAEWIFLTEKLGWNEGLANINNDSDSLSTEATTPLSDFMFVTEQMGWRKGLELSEEGRGSDEKGAQTNA